MYNETIGALAAGVMLFLYTVAYVKIYSDPYYLVLFLWVVLYFVFVPLIVYFLAATGFTKFAWLIVAGTVLGTNYAFLIELPADQREMQAIIRANASERAKELANPAY